MKDESKSRTDFLLEIEDLKMRLGEAEETLSAIRRGEVDGLVVAGPEGDLVFTLMGAEHSYRIFVEAMNEGAVTLSSEGTILYCNDRFAELVGIPHQKIIGNSIYTCVMSPDGFESAFRRGMKKSSKARTLLKNEQGEPIPVAVSFNPMQVEDSRICMVVTDLSEHIRQNELLKERADQLSRMSSQLTLAEQRERRRLAVIIHDHLQQSLVGAKINVEVLSGRLGKKHEKDVDQIYTLLMDSLKTARSLSAQMAPHILYERGLVQGLQWLARTLRETYQIDIETEIDEELLVEPEDIRVLLFASVRELLFNVVKHAMVESARLRMVSNEDGLLSITVEDAGMGFDPETMWQNAEHGSGFGLYAIRERLKYIGGQFLVKSAPGEGSTFTLIVPLEQIEKFRHTQNRRRRGGVNAANKLAAEPAAVEKNSKITVMLVDDHAVMRQGLSTLLGLHSDIAVVGEASGGEEAVELARKLEPDIILMDISMPGIDGIEATRIIHKTLPQVKIIGLSMFDAEEQAAAMIDAGAKGYCSKNDNSEDILSVIRSVMA
ncbi:MAG: response regulator [Syntrophales bacterium]|jgi:PAS domain S-box-containing protein|nr:response regulator [Syntrophales bacterium]MDY0043736.1 response regulator [Syntrophales bacterium]